MIEQIPQVRIPFANGDVAWRVEGSILIQESRFGDNTQKLELTVTPEQLQELSDLFAVE